MFGKSKPREVLWRALPLRNAHTQYSYQSNSLILEEIWFTPETIIFDAIDVATDMLWFWEVFRKALPSHVLRVFALALLFLIVIGLNQSAYLSAASLPVDIDHQVPIEKTVEISTQIKAQERLAFAWPVSRTYVSTPFSSYHKGIDIPNSYGSSVKPFAFGTVVFAGWDPNGFGNTIQIRHEKGYTTKYAHLSNISVVSGQKVGGNTVIGRVGATGLAYGSHLHFEIYKDGSAINPLSVLP